MEGMPWHLLLLAVLLSGIGAAFIRSSHSALFAQKHLVFAGAGCIVFMALAFLDYRHLSNAAPLLYAAGLGSLAALFVLGVTVNYARSWFDLGFVSVQPAEPMKYVLAIVLADYFGTRRRVDRLRDLLPPLVLAGAPTLLIMAQPDLGTALVMVPVFLGVAFLAGAPVRNLVIVVAAGCVLLVAAWFTPGLLKDYQRSRLLSFVDPARNPDSPAAYNAEQATMAVSAGGLTGQGWGQGVLTHLGRIPEQYADFIFPVIAEEWGFMRTAPLVCLYLLIAVLLARAARATWDPFGRLLIGGVLTIFVVQSLLHIAISLRLAPITGLTLPFVSYGGSSLVSTFAGFGLVASVRVHRSVEFVSDSPGG
jgi:rod shape determining protein RodA